MAFLLRQRTNGKTRFKINIYFMHSKTQEQKKWRLKVLFLRNIVGCVSPQLWLTRLKFPLPAHTCHQRDQKVSIDVSREIYITTSIIIWYYSLSKNYSYFLNVVMNEMLIYVYLLFPLGHDFFFWWEYSSNVIKINFNGVFNNNSHKQ